MAQEEVDFLDIFGPDLAKQPQESSEEEKTEKPQEEVSLEAAFESQAQDEEETDNQDTPSGKSEDGDDDSEDVTDKSEAPASDSSTTRKSSEDIDESPTLLFARFLSEQGNLTSYDEEKFKKTIEEEGEDEALAKLWNNEAEAIRNEILDTYDQDVKEYLDMLDSGVDPATAKDIVSNEKKLSEITPDSLEEDDKEDLRKDLIRQNLKVTTSFSDKKIDKLVDQAVSLGEDVEEAQEALEGLKKHYEESKKSEKEKVKKTQEEQMKAAEEQLKAFKEDVNKLEEIVPGMPLTKKQKQNIIDKLTKPVKEENGVALNAVWAKRQEDPFKFDTIVAALDDLGIFDGKWDKLTKRVKTDTVNKLKESLNKTSQRTRTGAPTSYGSDDEVMKNIESMKGII